MYSRDPTRINAVVLPVTAQKQESGNLSDFVFVLRAHISNITHAGYAACESLHRIIKLTYDFVNSLYEPLDFGASHFLIIISDLSLVKEEKMFRYLNIFCNYLVEISNRGDGV